MLRTHTGAKKFKSDLCDSLQKWIWKKWTDPERLRKYGQTNFFSLFFYKTFYTIFLTWLKNWIGYVYHFYQLGSVAGPVIQATGRLQFEDGLRTGVLLCIVTRWIGVRTKLGVNMDLLEESCKARLLNEMRNGPGPKGSRLKRSRRAVVGLRWRVHDV